MMDTVTSTGFTVHIELGNDAMQTPEDVAEALRYVANAIEAGAHQGRIFDVNGNGVGYFMHMAGE